MNINKMRTKRLLQFVLQPNTGIFINNKLVSFQMHNNTEKVMVVEIKNLVKKTKAKEAGE